MNVRLRIGRCLSLARFCGLLPLLFSVAPSDAAARLAFHPCVRPAGVQCATLVVPIDRAGKVPGTFSLHVERVRGRGRGALVALAGGPGQTNTDFTRLFALSLRPALATHDLYVFDQRGTGASGAVHCAAFERGEAPAQSVPGCAAQLGSPRNYYSTLESAQDMESLRRAISVRRLAVFGVSYGTYLAQAYAGLYPRHVESLGLDSPFGPLENADPFNTVPFRALPAVLDSVCARGACQGVISGFRAKVFALLGRLASQPLTGTYYDATGHPHPETLTQLKIAIAFPEIDQRPNLRAELPRAIEGALRGDIAPLARLAAGTAAGTPTAHPSKVNSTLEMVTRCEEGEFDFSRTASPDDRLAQARSALNRLPRSDFYPFSPEIAFGISLVPTCAYWPMLPTPPRLPSGRLPAVPALILEGESDLRTPAASARDVARQLPRARILVVPFVGHSVVRGDDTGCALRALAAFYGGHRVRSCAPAGNPYPVRPIAPTSLGVVAPAPGVPGQAGRVLRAVQLTVQDAFEQIDPGIYGLDGLRTAGGLRGGSYRRTTRGLVLDGDVFVPDVAVSGTVPAGGTARLAVSGKLSGTLAFHSDGRVTGRLGRMVIRTSAAKERATREYRRVR